MQLVPYLNFDGRCAAAFKFYETVLGGKLIMMMKHSETPMADQFPANWSEKIIHARLMVGDQILMGSDSPPDYYQVPQGMNVTLGLNEPQEAERVFHALAENGTVRMPLSETFWALRFGMLVDQFGTPWMINCERPA